MSEPVLEDEKPLKIDYQIPPVRMELLTSVGIN